MRKLVNASALCLGLFAGSSTAPAADQVQLFPLEQVRLLDGPFKAAQEVDRTYILAHDPDRLLAAFRREAGLPPKAQPYGNWESTGLDGHTAGHYLSALAMMSAATGDAEIKRRLDYMVGELAACQAANGNGYVGGVPRSRQLWDEVGAGKLKVNGFGVNDRWVPWYNVHKLFAGLRDAYLVGKNEQAKAVLIKLCDWCGDLIGRLSDEQVQQMLAAEHGGMNEVLADAFAITGNKKYLDLAQRFNDASILGPLVAGQDQLTGKHANTQIPKVIGFERIAALTGDKDQHRAAIFFWENVTAKRTVAIGGNSVNEHFHRPDDIKPMLEDATGPETCNTYNMLRLSEQLFAASPDARYADYYERALFNHILSTQHPQKGGFVYFTPMRPRHYRVYSQAEHGFWCCVGTGFENHAKYGTFIYAHEGNDALYVNLFIPSELQWPQRGVTLRQETSFPDNAQTRLRVSTKEPTSFTLHLRHPKWVPAGQLKVLINGNAETVKSTPSSYAAITRKWADGDTVEVQTPMQVTTEPLLGNANHVALLYGPIVLALPTGTEELLGLYAGEGRGDHIAPGRSLPLGEAPALVVVKPDAIAQEVKRIDGETLAFSASEMIRPEKFKSTRLIPFSRVHDTRYTVYWRVMSPDTYATEQKRIMAEERQRLALEEATLDRVTPGLQQSEVDHNFKGDRTASGNFRDRPRRDGAGWFSYDLKRPGEREAADLMVTYFGQDRDRKFDILVDDAKLASVTLDGSKGDRFFSERYPLPAGLGEKKDQPITIRFVSRDGAIAGGVFDVRVIKRSVPASATP